MKRYGRSPHPGKVYSDRPGAYAVILRGREALLAAHDDGHFLLPGGGIEKGEPVLHALHREVWEETGWTIAPICRLGIGQQFSWLEEESRYVRKVMHFYLCHPVRKISEPFEPDHRPALMDAVLASHLLYAEADRVFMKRGLTCRGGL